MTDLKSKPFYLNDAQCRWVEDTLNSMTDEEKIGQLFCVMGGDYGKEQIKLTCVFSSRFRTGHGPKTSST